MTLAILFFIFRQLLAKDIFPKLTRSHGGALLKQVVDRLFVLALIAMLLGFIGYLLPQFRSQPAPKSEPTVSAAEVVLQKLYAGDIASLYEQFPASARAQVPYGVFAASTRETMSQFRKPPRDRLFLHKQVVAGQMIFTFEAQFDETSRYRETLIYVDTDGRWTLWRFEIIPAEWPPAGMMKPLNGQSAGELKDRFKQFNDANDRRAYFASNVMDRWVQLPGWNARVESIGAQTSERSCDVRLTEESSGVPILVRNMLDGCMLVAGERVTVIGRVESLTNDGVEVSRVRYSRSAT